jgi:SpoVK/Ycf46/Vps4 family AAA+-type ATPase
VKEMINESIVYPLKNPELALKYGKKAGGGVIFYGPPGCGKTFIGKATAGECDASFLSVKISDIMDMYVGNTEKNIHSIFELARHSTPSIIFFDEIDGVGGRRDNSQQSFEKRAINQLLMEMDGVEYSNEGVLIVGSTNAPWYIDPALRRSGRFSRFIFFPEPDKKTREEVFRIQLKDKPVDAGVNFGRLARLTEGYSIADIKAVCSEAAAVPWKEALKRGSERPIQMADFLAATKKVKSSLPAWYGSVKKFLIKEEKKVSDKAPQGGRTIVVEHKRAQEELIGDEERKLFSDLVKAVSKQGSLMDSTGRKIRTGVARYIS